MTRSIAFVSLLAALAIGGYLATQQMKSTGPSSPTSSRAIDQAGGEVSTINLQQAALALEQFRAESGSYAGAALGGFAVQLVRADAASYCLHTLRSPVSHLAGPGGTPASGGC